VTDARSWRLTDSGLQFCQWPSEPEVVVYSPRSGSIHLVMPATRRLLEMLSNGPSSDQELTALVQTVTGLARADVERWLPDVLRTLRDAELIEASGRS
jgi:PqqD family protein of HPr-rel-A system